MLKIHEPRFETSAAKPEQFPKNSIPEIAFVGRSNVGKSSIINALLNRKHMAKVGAKPGMTRLINFFNIDAQFYLVDLPGYGYASISREKKTDWAEVIEAYLKQREQLRLIVLLVDIRHAPSGDDIMMLTWIKNFQVPYVVVATKYDKITRNALPSRIKDIRETLGLDKEETVIPFSSESKVGKEAMMEVIAAYLKKDDSEENSDDSRTDSKN